MKQSEMGSSEILLAIRCDANHVSGFGHVSRCVSLARHIRTVLPKAKIEFIGDYSPFAIEVIQGYGFDAKTYLGGFESVSGHIFQQAEWVILDSYLYKQDYLNALNSLGKKNIVIDDECLLDFSDVDWVWNFRFGAEEFPYSSKNKALGSNYFITKPELYDLRNRRHMYDDTESKSILLFFSGSDSKLTHPIAEKTATILLETYPNVQILYISKKALNVPESFRDRIELIEPTIHIEQIYERADFVINGGGLTKYESAFCMIPSASVSLTELQYEDSKYLEKIGILYNLGLIDDLDEQTFKDQLIRFVSNNSLHAKMITRCTESFSSLKFINDLLIRMFHGGK